MDKLCLYVHMYALPAPYSRTTFLCEGCEERGHQFLLLLLLAVSVWGGMQIRKFENNIHSNHATERRTRYRRDV